MDLFLDKTKLYKITIYNKTKKFIKNNGIIPKNKKTMVKMLSNDNYYNLRTHKNTKYTFFGDLDNYDKFIIKLIKILQKFMKKNF